MWRVVTGMTSTVRAQAGTALSPEWDHGFDEAFTDLVTSDPDWVQDEFDALISASWNQPPETPAPPAPADAEPAPPPPPRTGDGTPVQAGDRHPGAPRTSQRSPPRGTEPRRHGRPPA
jgi:hypothetical protein